MSTRTRRPRSLKNAHQIPVAVETLREAYRFLAAIAYSIDPPWWRGRDVEKLARELREAIEASEDVALRHLLASSAQEHPTAVPSLSERLRASVGSCSCEADAVGDVAVSR